MYDLTSEVTPITAKRYGAATRIHLDTQSQDGDSVNSLVHEDVCPTTETEHELRARQMEVEPVRQLGHQESSHSSVGQRQDLQVPRSNSPVAASDNQQPPLTDTQDATSLQEAGDDAAVGAEEMEMRGLDPLSNSDDDDPLYSRSSMAASPHSTGTAGDEELEVEMHDLQESEREHKPSFGYQQL